MSGSNVRDSGEIAQAALSSIGDPVRDHLLRQDGSSMVIRSAEGETAFEGFRDPRVQARLRSRMDEIRNQSSASDQGLPSTE